MDIDQIVRPLLLKDLRAELRLRGQSPAGGQEELRARLKENMMVTGNFNITAEGAMGAMHAGGLERPACNNCQQPPPRLAACHPRLGVACIDMLLVHFACAIALDISPAETCASDATSLRAGSSTADMAHGRLMNNYSRPGGQQVRSVNMCLAWGAPC